MPRRADCIRQDNSPDSKSETGLVSEVVQGFAAAEPGEEGCSRGRKEQGPARVQARFFSSERALFQEYMAGWIHTYCHEYRENGEVPESPSQLSETSV